MSTTLREIMDIMEEIAPAHLAEGWDQTGLAVGNPAQEIKKILVALDVIAPVIDEAIDAKADLILTHHPMLLFQKIQSIRTDDGLGSRLYGLIQHNIAAFSAHTNLDIAAGGTNDILAELAGLEEISLLEETTAQTLHKIVTYVPTSHEAAVRQAMCDAGAGQVGGYSHCTFASDGTGTFLPLEGAKPFLGEVGRLEEAKEARLETIVPAERTAAVVAAMKATHPYEEVAYDIYAVEQKGRIDGIGRVGKRKESVSFAEFAEELREKLGLTHIRLVGDGKKQVQRVALCTGSGAGYIETAHKAGADVYLTGDIKYHEAQRAIELGLCVVDVTHYASEALVVPVLKEVLDRKLAERGKKDIEVVCSTVDGQTFWEL